MPVPYYCVRSAILLVSASLFCAEFLPALVAQEKQPASNLLAPLESVTGFEDWVTALCWSPDGQYLACGSYEQVQIWSLAEKKVIQTITDFSGTASSLCFLPDSQRLLIGSYQQIHLVELPQGTTLREFKGHRGQVTALAMIGDDRFLSTADDTQFRQWDLGGRILEQWENEEPITALAVSSDQKSCVLALGDETRVTRPGEIVFFDLENWKVVQKVELHRSATIDTVYTSDGKHVLSSSFDETIISTNLQSNKPVGIFKGHSRPVNALAVHPHTDLIISGSGGRFKGKNELLVWELSTGKILTRIEPHSERISCLALSPDATLLAVGSHDKKVSLWKIELPTP